MGSNRSSATSRKRQVRRPALKAACAGIMACRSMASVAKPIKKRRVARPRTAAERQARLKEILRWLDEMHPNVKPPLFHRTPWELLVATILSAQSTDKLVNSITPGLFSKYPAIHD